MPATHWSCHHSTGTGATREGLGAARARGRVGGRPSVVTQEMIKAARDLLPDPNRSVTSIAKLLGISAGTLYNHIPDWLPIPRVTLTCRLAL